MLFQDDYSIIKEDFWLVKGNKNAMIYEAKHAGFHTSFEYGLSANFNFPLHMHRSFEFIVIRSGTLKLRLDDDIYELSAGDGALIFPYQRHAYISEGENQLYICIFSPDLAGGFQKEIKNFLPEKAVFKVELTRFEDNFDNVCMQKSIVYYICGRMLQSCRLIPRERFTDSGELIEQILRKIDESYEGECTLNLIAKELSYDYTYLSKYFRKMTGMSFPYYLNLCRITLACRIIAEESCPLSETAFRVGYSSIRNFNENFKKITGKTPTQYIKLQSNEN